MCRIVGFWDYNYNGNYNIGEVLTRMRDTLAHGGPDDAGVFIDKQSAIALGHRRLSILDLSSQGRQPMEFDDLVIVYNGEIYNYKELRKELEKKGYFFKTNTDTEVLLKAFHCWGFDCVYKFRGMWAFAIWDKKKRKLILCRDRVGVKPLYWYFKNGIFIFGSELKAFHKHHKFSCELNNDALKWFLMLGYIPGNLSIFSFTYKLLPGHFLVVKDSGELNIFSYYSKIEEYLKARNQQKKREYLNETELINKLLLILKDSFSLRLISDVPVGLFLSGGNDSSLVASILAKEEGVRLKTFTIGFYEEEYDESKQAEKIAKILGTEHTSFICSRKEALSIIPEIPKIYDEPFGDSSAIPTFLVSHLAKKDVDVVLSADGGDELFYGYTTNLKAFQRYNKFSKYKILSKFIPPFIADFDHRMKRLKYLLNANSYLEFKIASHLRFFPDEISSGYRIPYLNNVLANLLIKSEEYINFLEFSFLFDFCFYLPDDILVKVDRATMAVALEGREPFLDPKLIEFAFSLPITMKYRDGISKYILKKLLLRYLPREIVFSPKKGFSIPVKEWLRRDLYDLLSNVNIAFRKTPLSELISEKVLRKHMRVYLEKGIKADNIWYIFVFTLWYHYNVQSVL